MTRKILFAMMLLWTGFACAQENYQMAGPYEVVARDGKYAYTKGGSERDMWTAWQLAQKGESQTSGLTDTMRHCVLFKPTGW